MVKIQRCLFHLVAALESKKIMLKQDNFMDKKISENYIQVLRVSFDPRVLKNIIAKISLILISRLGLKSLLRKQTSSLNAASE
jgi:hypothetical protein